MKMVIMEYHEKVYTNKFSNLGEMDKIFKKHKII